jgi:hypothetical protein
MAASNQLLPPTALSLRKDPRYALNGRLSGPQSPSGRAGEEELSCPHRESNSSRPDRSLSLNDGVIPAYIKRQ